MRYMHPLGTAGLLLFFCFFLLNCTGYDTRRHSTATLPQGDGPPNPASYRTDGTRADGSPPTVTGQAGDLETARKLSAEAMALWKANDSDAALQRLDAAYAVLAASEPSTLEEQTSKDRIRLEIANRIKEINASRQTSVKGPLSEIPLTMNNEVETFIKRIQGPERKTFLDAYRRSHRYRPMIEDALRDKGLPEELAWIPLIESGYRTKAMSPSRALGLWQLIPSTATRFGLERNRWIDERMDPEKSTAAAVAYLKELHNIFGDWTTVLAAYNCGEGTVLKKIRGQKIDYMDNFWDLYYVLPEETAQFVPRFLAVMHIVNEPETYGFSPDELEDPEPVRIETVMIEKPVALEQIADKLKVDCGELEEINPDLRQKVTPDHPYRFKVPMGLADDLLASLDELPSCTLRSDTKTRQEEPPKTNKTGKSDNNMPGGTVKKTAKNAGAKDKAQQKEKSPPDIYYTVRKGDTLYGIARRFETDPTDLIRMNNLASSKVKSGQRLKVPAKAKEASGRKAKLGS